MLLKKKIQRMLRLDPPVLNQFKFDGNKGRAACVPICLLTLYHIADEIRGHHNFQCQSILNDTQWSLVMKRGIRLWERWHNGYVQDRAERFPQIEEILGLVQCQDFYTLFKKEDIDERDRAGLAIPSKYYENPMGSLYTLCKSMSEKDCDVYAVIIMPVCASAVALIYRPSTQRYVLFDPHGAAGSDRVTLLVFREPKDVVRYLLTRYQVDSIDDCRRSGVEYDEVELCEMYSYTASLFTCK